MNVFCAFLGLLLTGQVQASSEPLGFEAALESILDRSTALATQRTELEKAEYRRTESYFRFVPGLSFEASEGRLGDFGASLGSSRKLQARADLNLWSWGADWMGMRASRTDAHAREADLESTRLDVDSAGVRSLSLFIQRRKEIEIQTRFLAIQTKLFEIAQQRYRGGYLPLQETEKISVDLENARSELADAEIRSYEAKAALETLLGHSNIRDEWPWKDTLVAAEKTLVQAQLIPDQRPDLRAAGLQVEAETDRRSRTRRLLLPSLDGELSYGLFGVPNRTSDLTPGWTATLTLNFPFFDHLRSYTNARVQGATLAAAEAARTQVEREASSGHTSARDSFRTSLAAALNRQKTFESARKLYDDNLKRFQNGRISANDLAVDQRRLLDAELFSTQGWSNAHVAASRLCRSLGQGVLGCLKNAAGGTLHK